MNQIKIDKQKFESNEDFRHMYLYLYNILTKQYLFQILSTGGNTDLKFMADMRLGYKDFSFKMVNNRLSVYYKSYLIAKIKEASNGFDADIDDFYFISNKDEDINNFLSLLNKIVKELKKIANTYYKKESDIKNIILDELKKIDIE